jgi:outer membrane protein assembly factor BamB
MPRPGVMTLVLLGALAAGCGGAGGDDVATTAAAEPATETEAPASKAATAGDWPTFGRTPSRTSSSSASIGITAATAPRLRRQTIELPGTVDNAPIYLHSVRVAGARRNVFVMTTTYGRTLAVGAADGRILWTYTPPGISSWEGSYRITTASPVASADRRFVFSSSSDGRVHKLALAGGREVTSGNWPVTITRLPAREKVTPSFNLVRGRLVVATGGYIGDTPPYQGHLVTIDPSSGRIIGVFNSLCADRKTIIDPSSCPENGSAIWARSGAVAAPDGSLLFATGDGKFDGTRHFGDSVVRVSGDGRRVLGSWTPADHLQLDSGDVDLGSTAPVLIGGGSVLQSGKDAVMHVISFARLRRPGSVGRELQRFPTPGGAGMFSVPAVWRRDGRTFVFATTDSGTAAYEQRGGRLHQRWANGTAGTSPMLAGGLLYVYDPGGALVVYRPLTGRRVARLPAGGGHWNSPVPGSGVIALPEGDANEHSTSGTLSLYHRP